jgi:hypothetical protein
LTIAALGSGTVSGNGSAGQVPFWTGTSTIGGDSGLFWNNTSKHLGVGIANPLYPLHVVSGTGSAIRGATNSVNGAGVYATAGATDGTTFGGYFLNASTSGRAVYGNASATSGANFGGYFRSASNSGTGVLGFVTGTSGQTYGGFFESTGNNGAGVLGHVSATSGLNYGGHFSSASTSGYGVHGTATATGDVTTYGGYFRSGSTSGRGVYGYASATTGLNIGVYGTTNSPGGRGVHASAPTGGQALYCEGSFRMTTGTFWATPTTTTWATNKPATVKLNDGTMVKLFSEEAAELYFTDYGEGTLSNGRTHIELDPLFLQTVTIDAAHPMKVFVQLEGDCKGVFVTNKSTTGFDVAELQGGTSNASFSYRVVCKRKYYEDERLATEEEDIMYNTRMLEQAWPEVIAEQKAERARIEAEQAEHLRLMEAHEAEQERMRSEEGLRIPQQ